MRDVNEGDAQLALDPLELHLHLDPQLEVEGAERFVEKQDLWLIDDRPSQRDPLSLTAGQLVGTAVAKTGQAHHGESLRHSAAALLTGQVSDLEAVLDVGGHRHMRKERVILENGVRRPGVRRHRRHILSAEFDPAGIGTLETGDQPQQRRLTRTGWSQQREEFAFADREADIVDGEHAAVTL